jgi:hypothetical protein
VIVVGRSLMHSPCIPHQVIWCASIAAIETGPGK